VEICFDIRFLILSSEGLFFWSLACGFLFPLLFLIIEKGTPEDVPFNLNNEIELV